jgi:hypothetical protein
VGKEVTILVGAQLSGLRSNLDFTAGRFRVEEVGKKRMNI